MNRATRVGVWLLVATTAFVALGCGLFLTGLVGLAQLLWVTASGTAGAGIVLVVGQ